MATVLPIVMKMPDYSGTRKYAMLLMAAVVQTDRQLIIIDTGYLGHSDLTDQLADAGMLPQDFDFVVNTHVHPDHAGNNRKFVNAKIIVSKVDYEFQKAFSHEMQETADPVPVFKKFYPEYDLKQLAMQALSAQKTAIHYWQDDTIGREEQIHWIEENPDLPDGLALLHTPGHTPGHYAVKISGEANDLLMAGDVMPSRLFWKRNLRETTPRFSTLQTNQSRAIIEGFQGIIIGGHDRPFYTKNGEYLQQAEIIL